MYMMDKNIYRKSDEWKEYRKKEIAKANNRCQLCGVYYRTGLQVHHINPDQYTLPTPTIVLCNCCHRYIEHKLKVFLNPKHQHTLHSQELLNLLKKLHDQLNKDSKKDYDYNTTIDF